MKLEPTEDKCDKCKQRRKEGFAFCLCGNRLMRADIKFKSFNDTGNSHQGYH